MPFRKASPLAASFPNGPDRRSVLLFHGLIIGAFDGAGLFKGPGAGQKGRTEVVRKVGYGFSMDFLGFHGFSGIFYGFSMDFGSKSFQGFDCGWVESKGFWGGGLDVLDGFF